MSRPVFLPERASPSVLVDTPPAPDEIHDPFPDYDAPDPDPVDDVDVLAGACWCHDAGVCPDELSGALDIPNR